MFLGLLGMMGLVIRAGGSFKDLCIHAERHVSFITTHVSNIFEYDTQLLRSEGGFYFFKKLDKTSRIVLCDFKNAANLRQHRKTLHHWFLWFEN